VEVAVEPWLTIRTAAQTDLAELQRIYRAASLSNDGDAPALLARPEFLVFAGEGVASGRTLIAMADGPAGRTATGFATIAVTTPQDADAGAELEDLFVDPQWRRRGIAHHLLDQIVVIARDTGHRRLWVTGNHHALPFYRAVGFLDTDQVTTALGVGTRMSLDVETS
jgi:GNAT superfamily N-acetyltransferase